MEDKLLNAADYQLIHQLSLAAKRRVAGLITGEQRSPVQGGGIEFADYREYEPGDDIRRIDWAVFLRLRRLLVKLFAEEKELTLMLILDGSRSMRFGQPDKLQAAGRIAALLAGVAMSGGNRAGILAMGSTLRELMPAQRTQTSLTDAVKIISGFQPVDAVDPVACMRRFATRYGRRCMAVFLSDLLYPEWPQAIAGLAASGCEGYILHILAPEEISPPHLGEITLVDVENQAEVPMHIGFDEANLYRRELAVFLREARRTSLRHGLGYTMIATDSPIAQVFHKDLRRGGLVC